MILEAKLSSIPGIEASTTSVSVPPPPAAAAIAEPQPSNDTVDIATDVNKNVEQSTNTVTEVVVPPAPVKIGVKACEDIRYKKYFKMTQFGVPAPAVKLKMEAEGIDSSLLE